LCTQNWKFQNLPRHHPCTVYPLALEAITIAAGQDTIALTQSSTWYSNNSEERFNQDETTSDNIDDKNDEERFSLINNKMILSQELVWWGKKGVNKD